MHSMFSPNHPTTPERTNHSFHTTNPNISPPLFDYNESNDPFPIDHCHCFNDESPHFLPFQSPQMQMQMRHSHSHIQHTHSHSHTRPASEPFQLLEHSYDRYHYNANNIPSDYLYEHTQTHLMNNSSLNATPIRHNSVFSRIHSNSLTHAPIKREQSHIRIAHITDNNRIPKIPTLPHIIPPIPPLNFNAYNSHINIPNTNNIVHIPPQTIASILPLQPQSPQSSQTQSQSSPSMSLTNSNSNSIPTNVIVTNHEPMPLTNINPINASQMYISQIKPMMAHSNIYRTEMTNITLKSDNKINTDSDDIEIEWMPPLPCPPLPPKPKPIKNSKAKTKNKPKPKRKYTKRKPQTIPAKPKRKYNKRKPAKKPISKNVIPKIVSNKDETRRCIKNPQSRRKHTAIACIKCWKAKTRCSIKRPCARCTRIGCEDECIDRPATSRRRQNVTAKKTKSYHSKISETNLKKKYVNINTNSHRQYIESETHSHSNSSALSNISDSSMPMPNTPPFATDLNLNRHALNKPKKLCSKTSLSAIMSEVSHKTDNNISQSVIQRDDLNWRSLPLNYGDKTHKLPPAMFPLFNKPILSDLKTDNSFTYLPLISRYQLCTKSHCELCWGILEHYHSGNGSNINHLHLQTPHNYACPNQECSREFVLQSHLGIHLKICAKSLKLNADLRGMNCDSKFEQSLRMKISAPKCVNYNAIVRDCDINPSKEWIEAQMRMRENRKSNKKRKNNISIACSDDHMPRLKKRKIGQNIKILK